MRSSYKTRLKCIEKFEYQVTVQLAASTRTIKIAIARMIGSVFSGLANEHSEAELGFNIH